MILPFSASLLQLENKSTYFPIAFPTFRLVVKPQNLEMISSKDTEQKQKRSISEQEAKKAWKQKHAYEIYA